MMTVVCASRAALLLLRSAAVTIAVMLQTTAASAAPGAGSAKSPIASSGAAPLGISYVSSFVPGQGFSGAQAHLTTLHGIGFRQVTLVPTYPYVGLNRIDFSFGPSPADLTNTIALALDQGFNVVVKPHLDPLQFFNGADPNAFIMWRPQHTWRDACPWRGYYDVDPLSDAYQHGLIGMVINSIAAPVARHRAGQPAGAAAPMLKLELGTELMSSVVAFPHRWLGLLRAADGMRAAAGLAASLALSHNFEHHFQIGEDVVLRLDAAGRTALADLVRELDAIALSQYMDLTAAMPPGAFAAMPQGGRLPTPSEVAQALALHAAAFKQNILQGLLGLSPSEVPPLHLGEFGVGRGGLRHPNEWDGASTPSQEAVLSAHIARGYEGVVAYLQANETERGAESATLWITGPHFDVWGWEQPAFANKAAQARLHLATSG